MAAATLLTYDEAHFGLPLEALRTRERAVRIAADYVAMFETRLTREQQLRAVAYLRGVHLGAMEACAHAKAHFDPAGISAAMLLERMEIDLAERAAHALVARFSEDDM